MFNQATQRAIATNEDRAVAYSLGVCVKRFSETETEAQRLFGEGLAHLTWHGYTAWVNDVWFLTGQSDFFDKMTPEIRAAVIDNLVEIPVIDFHADEVLASLARPDPLLLLSYFKQRLAHENGEENSGRRYEAIPYDFHRLREVLAPVARQVINGVREWYDANDPLFKYRGGALVSRLYPDFPSVAAPFNELAASAEHDNVKYVLEILRGYHGDPAILDICKLMVAGLDPESPLLGEVELALDESGVISGEFGFVELYQARRGQMEGWQKDPRANVRRFAERRVRSLELQMRAEPGGTRTSKAAVR